MRATAVVLMSIAMTTPTLAQELRGGYDLVVRQHPTKAKPEAIIEVWSWTDFECSDGTLVLAGGQFRLNLSHPILRPGYTSDVLVDCMIAPPSIPPGPCDTWGSLQVVGTLVLPFAFSQYFETLSYDNPLHIMDVHMTVRDFARRDVGIVTDQGFHVVACVADGSVIRQEQSQPFTQGQATIRVSGGACRADFDGDGELTIFDFLAFQNAFDAGDLSADFDGDGELTIFDFLAFQNEFDAGCE